MAVNAAGSAQSAQQVVAALRQTVQAEQVVAAVVVQASQQAQQAAAESAAPSSAPSTQGVGENLDIEA